MHQVHNAHKYKYIHTYKYAHHYTSIYTHTYTYKHTQLNTYGLYQSGRRTHSYTALYTQAPSYTSLFFLKKAVLGIILKSNGIWGNGSVSVFKDTQLDLTGRA